MNVAANRVVTLEFEIHDENHDLVETTQGFEPMQVLIGHGDISPGMEEILLGLEVGDEFNAELPPEKAYGHVQTHLKQIVELAMFDGMDIEVGMQFQAQTAEGIDIITVIAIEGNKVAIDANHPLAGKTLHFKGKIHSVREASPEEIDHGHVHHHDHHH